MAELHVSSSPEHKKVVSRVLMPVSTKVGISAHTRCKDPKRRTTATINHHESQISVLETRL
jgi:hypothetical protein